MYETLSLPISATNPNYFTDRERSCGNVKLDYVIHTWQSPVKDSTHIKGQDEDSKVDNSHSFGLRPQRSGGGVEIKVRNWQFLSWQHCQALCSRHFKKVKIRKYLRCGNLTICLPHRFYVKSNFGEFTWWKMSFLALLQLLNFNFGKFEPFFKSQIY